MIKEAIVWLYTKYICFMLSDKMYKMYKDTKNEDKQKNRIFF